MRDLTGWLACGLLAAMAIGGLPVAVLAADAAAGAEAHYVKGEILYGDKWAPIDTVFKDYLDTRAELAGVTGKTGGPRDKLAEVQRQITQLKGESAKAQMPLKGEAAKAKNKLKDFKRALEGNGPVKPVMIPLPPQPQRPRRQSSSSYSGSSSSGYGSGGGYDSAYDRAQDDWQRKSDLIKRQNDAAKQKYDVELAAFKKLQDDARKESPKLEQTVAKNDKQLEQMEADLTAKLTPLMEQLKAANEDVGAASRQASAVDTRLKNLATALRTAPETLRLKHGIVEWEEVFCPLAELEKMYTQTQSEIDKVIEQMKADAAKSGNPLPADWKHPQQPRMDALKALIQKARTTGATAAPAKAAPTAPAA